MATFYILWDDNKDEWIDIGVINNNNLKIFFLMSPELYYIAQIMLTSLKDEENQKKPPNNDTNALNTKDNKKKPEKTNVSCLNEIINKILVYWQDLNFKPIPKYFWRMKDCYFLLGGKDNSDDSLIDILPLPMYNNNED